MSDIIESRVRTIVACVLDVDPANITPATVLFEGVIGERTIYRIGLHIECAFNIYFSAREPERWTDVADVILAVERAVAAKREAAA